MKPRRKEDAKWRALQRAALRAPSGRPCSRPAHLRTPTSCEHSRVSAAPSARGSQLALLAPGVGVSGPAAPRAARSSWTSAPHSRMRDTARPPASLMTCTALPRQSLREPEARDLRKRPLAIACAEPQRRRGHGSRRAANCAGIACIGQLSSSADWTAVEGGSWARARHLTQRLPHLGVQGGQCRVARSWKDSLN